MLERKTPIKTILERGILSILFLGVVFFAFNRLSALRKGPEVTLDSLVSGASIDSLITPISGTALRTRELRINGQEIFLNRDLRFEETLVLVPGFNVIEIFAEDRFGKQKTATFEIMSVQDGVKSYWQTVQEHRALTRTLVTQTQTEPPPEILGVSDETKDEEVREMTLDETQPEDESIVVENIGTENDATNEKEEETETNTQEEIDTVESENPEE